MNRRRVLQGLAVSGLVGMPIFPGLAQQSIPPMRWAKTRFAATGEMFNDIYFQGNQYIRPAVEKFSVTVRDYRANKAVTMHPWLLDIIFVLHWRYQVDVIRINSGYRAPETNASLEGAAKDSQHMRGTALDIVIPGLDHEKVARDMATFVHGGVGMYPGQGFVHFDFGNLRRWVG